MSVDATDGACGHGERGCGHGSYQPDRSADLDCADVASEPVRVVCGPQHPLAGRRIRSLRRLAGEQWLAFPNARKLPETSPDNLFAQFLVLGISDLRWTPVDSLTAQKRLVEAGYGLAALADSAIGEELKAKTLATIGVAGVRLASPVCLVTRRGGYLSPAAVAFIELLRGMSRRRAAASETSE